MARRACLRLLGIWLIFTTSRLWMYSSLITFPSADNIFETNPVICEAMIQACAQVIGNDLAITIGGQGGVFELNLMLPLIAHNLTNSITILANCTKVFTEKLITDLKADHEKCASYIEGSLAMCTSLAPVIGYDKAADIAYKAYNSGKTVREIAIEENVVAFLSSSSAKF